MKKMKKASMNPMKTKINQLIIKKSLLLGLFLSLLFLVGCGYKYLPKPDKDLMISDDYAIWKQQDFVFTVTEQMWIKDPQYLSDHYNTFFVRIQNTSAQPILISKNQFAYLDENRTQTDPVTPDEVLDLMMRDESLYTDQFMVPIEKQQEIQQRKSTIQRNLITDSFQFGEILPRAAKQGFIYFPKAKNPLKEFILVFRNKEITFERTK